VTGHPINSVQETLSCGGALVPIEGPAINRLVRSASVYDTTVIPGGTYSGESAEIGTYGVRSLLLSSTNTPQRIVREITRSVFEQSDQLRNWHRAFRSLEPAGMARGVGAVDAPLHPGAEDWLNDEGLL
jgi:TRAP transporter TAXI family solute receptor